MVALSIKIYYSLQKAGYFLTIENYFKGSVNILQSPEGIEDIEIDDSLNIAYLSSLDRRNGGALGAIYSKDLNNENSKFINLTQKFNFKEFKPHGISLVESKNRKFLFVINHSTKFEEVLIFEIINQNLNLIKKIHDDKFKSLNDISALNLNEFFVTNDHNSRPSFGRTLSDIASIYTGNIVYYNSGISRIIEDNIGYANGINVSKNKKYLFASSTLNNELYVYDLSNKLKISKINSHNLGISPDNIDIDQEENLYIACHPKTLQFMAHAKEKKNKSSSAIIKIIYLPNTDYKFLQEGLFVDDGMKISGSSVAAQFVKNNKTTFLVGSVFESKILELQRE